MDKSNDPKEAREKRLSLVKEVKGIKGSCAFIADLLNVPVSTVWRMKTQEMTFQVGRKAALTPFQLGILIEGLRITRWHYPNLLRGLAPVMPYLPGCVDPKGRKQINEKTIYLQLKDRGISPLSTEIVRDETKRDMALVGVHVAVATFPTQKRETAIRRREPMTFTVLSIVDRVTGLTFIQAFRKLDLDQFLGSIAEFKRMLNAVQIHRIHIVTSYVGWPDLLSVLKIQRANLAMEIKKVIKTERMDRREKLISKLKIDGTERAERLRADEEAKELIVTFEEPTQGLLRSYELPEKHRTITALNKKLINLTIKINEGERKKITGKKKEIVELYSPVETLMLVAGMVMKKEEFKNRSRMRLVRGSGCDVKC